MLKQVAVARDSLSKAELRLAEIILKQPEDVITMNMVDLKKAADVSDPTIVAFCQPSVSAVASQTSRPSKKRSPLGKTIETSITPKQIGNSPQKTPV